ncbi:MAG: hypothetical protein K0R54_2857 [Clostridiaceae bacterium]|jgi:uncharacterized protein YjbI with pentapeptide repeats|nr:hypothetical protein [Clostridiaceae bacterium]
MTASTNNVKILRPKLSVDLSDFSLSAGDIQDDISISLKIIKDCCLANFKAVHVCFDQVLFRNVVFSNVSLQNVELTDVIFENCDLSNLDFRGSAVYRTEFKGCKLVGTNFSETTLRNVIFQECSGKYSLFRFTDCKQVIFNNSEIPSSDFGESKFLKVEFKNTYMIQCQMCGTKLKGIDFSSCQIDGMGAKAEDVYGAVVSIDQAASLSALLGLVIKKSP